MATLTGTSQRDRLCLAFAEHLARLPAMQARAFRMRDVEGWPAARICQQLGVSDETLAELLFEARSAMCRALALEGFAP